MTTTAQPPFVLHYIFDPLCGWCYGAKPLIAAAQAVLQSPSAENLDLVETALSTEQDREVKARMEEARAVSVLASDRSADEKRAAIDTVASLGGREAIGILMSVSSTIDESLKPDLDSALRQAIGE